MRKLNYWGGSSQNLEEWFCPRRLTLHRHMLLLHTSAWESDEARVAGTCLHESKIHRDTVNAEHTQGPV